MCIFFSSSLNFLFLVGMTQIEGSGELCIWKTTREKREGSHHVSMDLMLQGIWLYN